MPTSAAGNEPGRARRTQRGLTLIELLVVVALIAVATAGVTLSLRDSALDALERDAQRLSAMLEAARAQSRASGTPVLWQSQEGGVVWQGLPRTPAHSWLSNHTRAQSGPPVVLGPEPLVPPQQITLYSTQSPGLRLWVATDGVRPFAVRREAANPP